MNACPRCSGALFPDEDGDRTCILCGEVVYAPIALAAARLFEAVALQWARDRGLGTAHRSHRVGQARTERAVA